MAAMALRPAGHADGFIAVVAMYVVVVMPPADKGVQRSREQQCARGRSKNGRTQRPQIIIERLIRRWLVDRRRDDPSFPVPCPYRQALSVGEDLVALHRRP